MSKKKLLVLLGIFVMAAVLLAACAGEAGPAGPQGEPGPAGPQGEQGPAGESLTAADLACAECHNDTSLITGKVTQWEESVHGSGTAYDYAGGRASCTGCHSGGGFSARIAAGITDPGTVEAGDPHPTRQDCRACHQIHTTYTGEDWALETTDPVPFYAFEGVTYDGGLGNLCANCHQPRRGIADPVDGMIEVTSTHWGPHHGGQGSMLLGIAGAGFEGSASPHMRVENTCVSCHMVNDNHTWEPNVAACAECHGEIENFDINGVQTRVEELLDELGEMLIARGLLDEEGHPAVTTMPENEAYALWNWIYIAHEDGSMGVHNPNYIIGLLETSIALLGE